MSDFIDAFKQGVKAAKEMNSHIAQIDSVFEELADSVKLATDGRFSLVRDSTKSNIAMALAAMAQFSSNEYQAEKAQDGSIYLCSVEDPALRQRVAGWVKQPKGFVFTLYFDRREIIAKSKGELSRALSDLLASPTFGMAFLSLSKTKPYSDAAKISNSSSIKSGALKGAVVSTAEKSPIVSGGSEDATEKKPFKRTTKVRSDDEPSP